MAEIKHRIDAPLEIYHTICILNQVLPIHYFLQPIVDFQTKFLGANILAIPGVDNVLDVRFICLINFKS